MNPVVSVIIPTKNRAQLLPRAIKSILDQTYKDFEIIIINGHSTDNTEEVVLSFTDPRIRYSIQSTCGNGAQATNEGIEKAKGKYIAFLDDDDEWLPDKLLKQVRLLDSLPDDYGMIYCWMDYYDSNERLLHQTHPTINGDIFDKVLLQESIGGTPTYLVRKKAIDIAGGFDPNLVFGDDGEFVRRIAKRFKVGCLPEVLAKVHVNHGFERQSDMNKDTIPEAIRSFKYIMEKYSEDFDARPKIKSVALAILAGYYARSRSYSDFLRYFLLSAKTSLTPLGKYKMMTKSLF